MASDVTTAPDVGADRPSHRAPRAEYVLLVLALASLALIPIHIKSAYSGLPAHPLLLHVPVIFIPVAVIGAIVLAVRPSLFSRWGVGLAIVSVIALAGTILTIGAGEALRDALGLTGSSSFGPSALVARHAHAAVILRALLLAFTLVFIVCVLAHRVSAGRPTGHAALDGLLSRTVTLVTLRVAVVVLAVLCGYFVWHVGDLGAKAVWQGRLAGPGGGGFSGGGFPGGGAGGGGGAPNLFGGGAGGG